MKKPAEVNLELLLQGRVLVLSRTTSKYFLSVCGIWDGDSLFVFEGQKSDFIILPYISRWLTKLNKYGLCLLYGVPTDNHMIKKVGKNSLFIIV